MLAVQETRIYNDKIYYIYGYHKLVKIMNSYKSNQTIRLSVFNESFEKVKNETESQTISLEQWEKTPKVCLRENELSSYEFLECNTVIGYQVTEIPYNCKYFKEANNNGKKTT